MGKPSKVVDLCRAPYGPGRNRARRSQAGGWQREETHGEEEGRSENDAAAGTLRLFGNCGPAATQAAWRSTHRVLDHRQSRSMGHRQADGTPGTGPANRPDAPTRRAQLELARIRYAGGRVALLRSFQKLRIRPTLAINARVCEDYTRVAE